MIRIVHKDEFIDDVSEIIIDGSNIEVIKWDGYTYVPRPHTLTMEVIIRNIYLGRWIIKNDSAFDRVERPVR